MSGDALVVILNPNGSFDTRSTRMAGKSTTLDVRMSNSLAQLWPPAATGPRRPATARRDQWQRCHAAPAAAPRRGGPPQVVSLSATEDDRFWGVTFDASDNVYAAGFVTVNGDSQTAVARFTTDGVLDPTFGTAGVATGT